MDGTNLTDPIFKQTMEQHIEMKGRDWFASGPRYSAKLRINSRSDQQAEASTYTGALPAALCGSPSRRAYWLKPHRLFRVSLSECGGNRRIDLDRALPIGRAGVFKPPDEGVKCGLQLGALQPAGRFQSLPVVL